jgi:hypothetical protein
MSTRKVNVVLIFLPPVIPGRRRSVLRSADAFAAAPLTLNFFYESLGTAS